MWHSKNKKVLVLVIILLVLCAATFLAMNLEERKEQIKATGETVLEIDPDTIDTLSFENESDSLSFHKADGAWQYDDDAAFPVDNDRVQEMLELFQSFGAAFTIEDVDDYGQYGLDDPVCTIQLSGGDQSYEIKLGDFSSMDSQRYVDFGDGNVYLAATDPLDLYGASLRDMIQQDEIPGFQDAESFSFDGKETYSVTYREDGDSYCEDDLYFNGKDQPLDTERVRAYFSDVINLAITNYVTYNATDEDLRTYGLDSPEQSVTINYTPDDDEEEGGTVVLHISRDPDELAEEAKKAEDADTGDSLEDSADEEIHAFARVGDSGIIYQITGPEYVSLMACGYDSLRHREMVTGDQDAITGLDITLEGQDYALTSEGDGDDRKWRYQDGEADAEDLLSAVMALSAASSEDYTTEAPADKEEIRLTLHLDSEEHPELELALYRYDGSSCLCQVNGETVAKVPRSQAVSLVEAVNAIVLN